MNNVLYVKYIHHHFAPNGTGKRCARCKAAKMNSKHLPQLVPASTDKQRREIGVAVRAIVVGQIDRRDVSRRYHPA